MNHRTPWMTLFIALACCFLAGSAFAGESRLGLGAFYWTALEDLDEVEDIEEDGFSYLVTYQYRPGLIGLELDLEIIPDRFADDAVAPQAYVLLGDTIYVGAGVGWISQDGELADEPFYALKAGLDLDLFTAVHLDLSVNYRANDTSDLEDPATDIDTDTLFLGAAVRIEL